MIIISVRVRARVRGGVFLSGIARCGVDISGIAPCAYRGQG